MKELIKLDQLNAVDMSEEYTVDSLAKTQKEITFLRDRLSMTTRMSLVIVFELGRRLVAVRDMLDHGDFSPWLEENCTIARRTAYHYIKVYQQYKDEPAELLEDKSIQEAYIEAGIKKAAPDEDDKQGELKLAGKADLEAEKANMVAVFERKTLSGRPLKNHRVENVHGRIYIYRKDVGTVAPALDLYLGKPQGMPDIDWYKMQEDYVIATELYLAKLEKYEETGLVEPPEDNRMMTVVEEKEHSPAGKAKRGKESA